MALVNLENASANEPMKGSGTGSAIGTGLTGLGRVFLALQSLPTTVFLVTPRASAICRVDMPVRCRTSISSISAMFTPYRHARHPCFDVGVPAQSDFVDQAVVFDDLDRL